MLRKRTTIRDYQIELQYFKKSSIVSFIVILLLTCLLLLNLYDIQINQYQDYQTRSNDNRIKIVPISPNRGLIFDRNGNLLAENRPVFQLEIVPGKVKDIDYTIAKQQQIFPQITSEHIKAFKKEQRQNQNLRFKSIPLLTQLTPEQVAKFSVNQHKYPGVSVNASLKRYYPYGEGVTHIIGYISRINEEDMKKLIREGKNTNYQATRNIGKVGIERYYEEILHGTSGYQKVEVNSQGNVIRILKHVPAIPGKNIILNLDIELQLYIYRLFNGRKGAAIVLNPSDNSILAMVSSPSYNPNLFVHGISNKIYSSLIDNKNRPLVNRATLSIYPPASTIKPFISIAALEEGIITPTTTRNDPGYWNIPNSNAKPFRDWLRFGHGEVNISKAIEESVDTFFYQIAYTMGIDKISKWMMMFGFGKYTGIDIYEESKANMPTRAWKMDRYNAPWYQGDTIPVGIGQGYWTATPIQISKATSILVNHGKVMAPHLLRTIIDSDHNSNLTKISKIKTYPSIKGIPKQYWNIAADGMKLVNHGKKGTARKAFKNTKYLSAGKSGTAQVFTLSENEEYKAEDLEEHLRDHALFTGFAPFKKPKFIVTVVLENAGGGSSHAGPFVRKIFDRAILGKEKDLKD
ncbi:penicillin-binding protein [Candidatus Photodesmus katoptron]|uniref:Peptidoglycan D,D-transpeptidase MrdA n=1 Tax=Candidatus Photodesmus katoptron Akat1 TaxID=1236703 RepID=S3DI59_9GAMM|nr:penicillin-binding protein 2 [Candidatus Photodesmus katoptron]EPE37380.1 penicillin-binding protein [Candidatus Photodesmus katoptron Akat1]KEY90787.1 penicillin-binding protein [Candidatus Photodesmus katoptron]